MERRVVVEVERIEDALDIGGGSFFEDVVGEDPREGHLDGKLDPLPHRHLQVELPVPQLAQVATVLETKNLEIFHGISCQWIKGKLMFQ